MKVQYTTDGFFAYRTKLLRCDHADSFAACLRANRDFRAVEVIYSERAKGERAWYVTFQPSNAERMADIGDREQAARIQRADREGAAYVFVENEDAPRPSFYCFNPKSGECYETTRGDCTCPDYEYRCKSVLWTGMACKHIHELRRRLEAGEVAPKPRVYGLRRYTTADAAGMAPASW